ncbi:hypothetical protein BDV06DRAFT_219102 [Aspergillus oleicola]
MLKDEWLSSYLETEIASAFKADEDISSQADFIEGLGKDSDLNPFLWRVMVKFFKDKISELRDGAIQKFRDQWFTGVAGTSPTDQHKLERRTSLTFWILRFGPVGNDTQ